MTNFLKLFLSCIFMGSLSAQVGINTPMPDLSAQFDMSNAPKGFLAPRVALTGTTDTTTIGSPKEGLLVYNITSNSSLTPGYYYWDITASLWKPFYNNSSSTVNTNTPKMYASVLGYNPYGVAVQSPAAFSYNGVNATKQGCYSFTDTYSGAPKHTYCSYNLSASVDWNSAFNMGKFLNGYITVITSQNEWNFIKTSVLTGAGNSNNNVWIGYNTIQYPGNSPEYTWITGEKSDINWSNSSTLQTNYPTGVPNGTSGCVRISPSSNATRGWYNDTCSSTTLSGSPLNFLIVEFNN
ncbi:C-type lectin domain-containing protein [Chryseobacterium arachidis]|uniref:C-type lectin domain-containing protein n=1 Tax=Chryseobacterium arachidis TaxID=1416778 RepID=UPI003620434A